MPTKHTSKVSKPLKMQGKKKSVLSELLKIKRAVCVDGKWYDLTTPNKIVRIS